MKRQDDQAKLVQVTDQVGNLVETMTMTEAFEKERIRHTVYVVLINRFGKYLLQQRSKTVPNYPSYWDASAGGHIDAGEDPESAAYRELFEEIGAEGLYLTKKTAFYFQSTDETGRLFRYYSHAYSGQSDKSPTEFKLDDKEVSSVRWVSKDNLKQLGHVTPITQHILRML